MKKCYIFIILIFILSSVFPPFFANAATLLTDDFTGTTIDTNKWTEIDSAGAGGSSGDIQQNGTLTVANSYSGSTWGQRALVSADTFDPTDLQISAVMTRASDQLLGYGNYNFQAGGTKSYILDLVSGAPLALAWEGGSLRHNSSCGTYTAGATYRMNIISTGFEIYKNDVLACTLTVSVAYRITSAAPVYLQSSATASTFDDVLVTGPSVGPTVPDAPTGLSAEAGNTEVDLSWTAPADNGGDAITDYLVEYKLNSEPTTWTTFNDGTSTSTSATVTGLTNGSQYNFRVSATNGVGTGDPSSTANAIPSAPSAPGAPTGLNATAGNTEISLTWTAPVSTGGSPITDYLVEYKLNSEPTTWTTFNDGTSTSTSATVTGLTNESQYNFRVSATNAIGTGDPSSTANATPANIGVVLSDSFTGTTIDTDKWVEEDDAGAGGSSGDIIQNGTLSVANSFVGGAWGATYLMSAEEYSNDQLEISVVMTANSAQLIGYGDPIFGNAQNEAFLLYRTGSGTSAVWALSWTGGNYTPTTSCGTGVQGATYTLKVIDEGFEVYINDVLQCTHDAGFDIESGNVFFQTQSTASTFDDVEVFGYFPVDTVPDAPTIGTATAGNAQASVTFSAPGNNGGDPITGYTATSSPGGITGTGASSPITVTGLTNGVSYTFTVTATNGVGTSNPSSASNSVTPETPPPPGQVTGLVATGFNRQVLLGWDAPSTGGTVEDYIVEYKLSSSNIWTTFNDGTSTTKKATVTGLINASEYNFRVSASNSEGAGTVSSTATVTPDEIDLLSFVITGESNSGGIGLNSDATAGEIAARPAVQIMNLTSGQFLFEDLDIGTNNLRDHAGLSGYYDNSHGFELQLANSTEANAFPDNPTVYLTKTGQGGSTIAQWSTGNGSGYWTKFLERTAAAKTQLAADRKWVVWLSIGINDGIAGTNITTFKTNMADWIDRIKADLPGAIIILTQFQSMSSNSGYPSINTALSEIAADEPNVYVVDTTGAGLRDGNHWSYAGLKTVASSMVTTTKNVLGLNYPGKVTSLSGTPSSTSVALSWTAPVSNGGNSITDYLVEYKTSASSTWTTFADGTSTSTSATVTGLSGSTDYNFRVSALNSSGYGNPTTANATTTDGTAPVISSVNSTPSNTSVVITWTTNELASSIVEYGNTNSYGASTIEADTSPRVTSHSVTLNNLLSCTTYNYRVKSNDASSNLATGSNNTFTTTGCTGSSNVSNISSGAVSDSGDTISLTNGLNGLSMIVPASFKGGVSSAIFQIKELDGDSVIAVTSTPSGKNLISNYIYHLSSIDDDDLIDSFDNAITITISYDDADLVGIDESSLRIYRHDGNAWYQLDNCIVDTGANTITCTTTSFSDFGVFGEETTSNTTGTIVSSGSMPRKFIASTDTNGCLLGYNFSPLTGAKCPISTSSTISTSNSIFTRTLKLGIIGEDVLGLQKLLNSKGFTVSLAGPGSIGNETTKFGPLTKKAVQAFQKAKGLVADGIVGPKTIALIAN